MRRRKGSKKLNEGGVWFGPLRGLPPKKGKSLPGRTERSSASKKVSHWKGKTKEQKRRMKPNPRKQTALEGGGPWTHKKKKGVCRGKYGNDNRPKCVLPKRAGGGEGAISGDVKDSQKELLLRNEREGFLHARTNRQN